MILNFVRFRGGIGVFESVQILAEISGPYDPLSRGALVLISDETPYRSLREFWHQVLRAGVRILAGILARSRSRSSRAPRTPVRTRKKVRTNRCGNFGS